MRNLYHQTCRVAFEAERLEGGVTADVAIVGGGYTGLSTALHLAERGLRPVVVEAETVGHGCSGRNGGQVNPGLKLLPDAVEAHWPGGRGARMVALSWGAPEVVFGLVERHGIDCAPKRSGTIRAAIGAEAATEVRDLTGQCRRRGGDVRLLGPEEMREMTGSAGYRAGAIDARGGHLNPLAYARGLALAATRAGARVFAGSRALAVARDGTGWKVATAGGSVAAGALVVATNGYTDGLWPGLKRTLAPVYSYITATDPLPEAMLGAVMPCRSALYEAGWDVVYYRVDDAGRLLMGGRGPQRGAKGPEDFRHLIARAEALWPGLGGVAWPWRWYGQVAITRDQLPRLTAPAPGAYLMLGYNGRGIAMSTVAGRELAALVASGGREDIALPVYRELEPIPLHGFWRLGAEASIAWHRARDALRRG